MSARPWLPICVTADLDRHVENCFCAALLPTSAFHSAVQRYLSIRKGLGYKYDHQTRRLADFVSFMDSRKATTITTKLAMEWATLPPDRHASWALRLTDVRGLARHIANIDPKTEVPPVGILPGLKRAKPYIYSDAEIDALLAAALSLPPAGALRRWTYHGLFGVIAVTGMRLSAAINLRRPAQRCATTPNCAIPICPRNGARTSSSRNAVARCCISTFIASSGACRVRLVCDGLATMRDLACMTCGIGSPSARC